MNLNFLVFTLSFRNLLKNRRNTISIGVGIFITLSLFTAINFNLTLSRDSLIRQNVTDFSIQGTYTYLNPTSDFVNDSGTWQQIASEPEISSVIPYTSSYIYSFNQTTSKGIDAKIFGVQKSYLLGLQASNELVVNSGSLDLQSNNASIIPVIGIKTTGSDLSTTEITQSIGLQIPITLKIVAWITVDTKSTIFSSLFSSFQGSSIQEFNLITYFNLLGDLSSSSNGLLKINVKSSYINYDNLDQTSTTYTNLVNKLNQKYPNYIFYSSVPIEIGLADLVIAVLQLVVIIFLLPFLFITCYISYLASHLNVENRRIQYGLFLARGGKNSTISNSYRFEGVVIGSVIGFLVFFLTPIFGLIIHYWLPSTSLPSTSLPLIILNFYTTQYIQLMWDTLGGALLGFLIMYIPRYYIFLNPRELLETHRVEETDVRVKGNKDLIFLIVGLSPIAAAIFYYTAILLQLPLVVTILVLQVSALTVYIVPFSPFLITYGLSAFLARQTKILKFITDVFGKFYLPDLKEVIDKTIFSKVTNLTRIAFVIALSFTFIIVPLVASGSIQSYSYQTLTFQIGGSDLAISNYDSNVTTSSILQNTFVQSATEVQWESYNYNAMIFLYINANSYFSTANVQSYWNINERLVNQLTNQEILVNQQFLTSFNVKVDDSFPINGSEYKILGTFGAVGGTDIYSKNIPLVLFSGLQNDPFLNSRILIKLKDPNNLNSVNTTITNILESDPQATILSHYNFVTNSNANFNFIDFILQIIDVQAYLLAFLSLGALLFLMIIRIKERTREIGNWRSRGLSSDQLQKLIRSELFILSTFGFLIGLFSGGLISFAIQYILGNVLFAPNSIIPYTLVIPFTIFVLIVIYAIGTVILSLIINYWALNMKLSKQIHYEEYMR